MGGFNPDLTPRSLRLFIGDGEAGLNRKLRQSGAKAMYHPNIKLHHIITPERLTVQSFINRCFVEGLTSSYAALRYKSSTMDINISIPDLHTSWNLNLNGDHAALYSKANSVFREGFIRHQTINNEISDFSFWIKMPNYWNELYPLNYRKISEKLYKNDLEKILTCAEI